MLSQITALKMLAALEAQRLAENAIFMGKSDEDEEYRYICTIIAKQAGFKSRTEWMDILRGDAEFSKI